MFLMLIMQRDKIYSRFQASGAGYYPLPISDFLIVSNLIVIIIIIVIILCSIDSSGVNTQSTPL